MWEVRLCLPHVVAGWILGHREAPRHHSGVGKLSLRRGTDGAGAGVPRPMKRLELWSSQTLGHSGTSGSCERAENRIWAHRLDLAWGQGEIQMVPRGSPWLDGSGRLGLGGHHGWECREAFYRRLNSSSVGKGLPHGSQQRIQMKRDSLWF